MEGKLKALWEPSLDWLEKSNLYGYRKFLKSRLDLDFKGYEDLHQWSVSDYKTFWVSVLEYFEIAYDGKYDNVCTGQMPNCQWFEGISLNYVEHFFRNKSSDPALIFHSEVEENIRLSWDELESRAASVAQWLTGQGVKQGDRVVGYLPNCPEATIAFIATASIGAIWSSCSPDFGVSSVIDRFGQIEPKVIFGISSYQYGGKEYQRLKQIQEISKSIPSILKIVDCTRNGNLKMGDTSISDLYKIKATANYKKVPFGHPLWILYSSGTTGKPKAIVHGHGGSLLEHYKYLSIHNNVKQGEHYFWYSTTGWMMWNYSQAALLLGATVVLYDGSPAYPNLDDLWSLVKKYNIHHFGTSAPYILACMKKKLSISAKHNLSSIKSISSTGSPLPADAFKYVYGRIKKDVWLISMSGGTDVCTAFVGGIPGRNVYADRIQGIALGVDLQAWNSSGHEIKDELGELVVCKPMPAMPLFFWNDLNGIRYREAYFSVFEGIWRHGDYIKIYPDGQLQIFGRSDATLNRHGVRIGTSEIYNALLQVAEVSDGLVVNVEKSNGQHFMPLFVKLHPGIKLGHELREAIKATLRRICSPRHVPDEIIQVKEIPYTLSGKKMETPIKKIMMGIDEKEAISRDAMRNPEGLAFYLQYAKSI